MEFDKMSNELILKNKYKRIFRSIVEKKSVERVFLLLDFKMDGKVIRKSCVIGVRVDIQKNGIELEIDLNIDKNLVYDKDAILYQWQSLDYLNNQCWDSLLVI